MSKKQTRRSVSLNRRVFEDAKAAAKAKGISLSQYVEAALRAADPIRALGREIDQMKEQGAIA